jgi:hypothetical protein
MVVVNIGLVRCDAVLIWEIINSVSEEHTAFISRVEE